MVGVHPHNGGGAKNLGSRSLTFNNGHGTELFDQPTNLTAIPWIGTEIRFGFPARA